MLNIKRALQFSVFFYIALFVEYIVLIFLLGQNFYLPESLWFFLLFWIFLVPVTLLLSKWYFRTDTPTAKKGFLLGLLALVVACLIDILLFTFFIDPATRSEMISYVAGDWRFYIHPIEILILTAYAGYEFDSTFTKPIL